jgi:uncharacterized transporter YbjL
MRETWFRISWWTILLLLCPGWLVITFTLTSVQLAMGVSNISSGFGSASVPIITFYNAFLDLGVLILPVGMAWKLQLTRKKKAGVIAVFILGSLGSFISFFRAGRSIDQLMRNWDPRYKLFNDAMLGVAEATAILICACLPVMRPLFRKAKQKTMRSARHFSRSQKKSAGQNPYDTYDEEQQLAKMRNGAGILRKIEYTVDRFSMRNGTNNSKSRSSLGSMDAPLNRSRFSP